MSSVGHISTSTKNSFIKTKGQSAFYALLHIYFYYDVASLDLKVTVPKQ